MFSISTFKKVSWWCPGTKKVPERLPGPPFLDSSHEGLMSTSHVDGVLTTRPRYLPVNNNNNWIELIQARFRDE